MVSVVPETISQLRSELARRFPAAGVSQLHPPTIEISTGEVSPPPPRERDIRSGLVTELVGPHGAGGCSLLLEHLAEQSAPDRYAAYVDMTGTFYPPAAAAFGVPLDRLILIKPPELSLALRIVEVLVRGGAARTVALDLPPQVRSLRLPTYHRLRRHVRQTGVSLVFLVAHPLVPADRRIDLTSSGEAPLLSADTG